MGSNEDAERAISSMATHPVEHEDTQEPQPNREAPNPTRLPVEPEFGPQPPAAEPEDPVPRPPPI